MKPEILQQMLEDLVKGNIDVKDAMKRLKKLPFDDLGFAKVDNHRSIRTGYPEVIYCPGKAIDHIKKIVSNLMEYGTENIMLTRADKQIYESVLTVAPDAVYYDLARIIVAKRKENVVTEKIITVVSAGTADLPVAEEAVITAEVLGNRVERLYDVGVAGIHRLLSYTDKLNNSNVIIVVAGMEGALASVVGGLVDKPVIAVPTSVGYGANLGGISALLSMLNSCASGVGVVNIDNGFGAAYLASNINKL